MKRLGFSWRSVQLLALVLVPVSFCSGQSAKEWDEIGTANPDQCAGLKQVCRAAGMDKKYKKDCENYQGSLNGSSNQHLTIGYDNLNHQLYPSATFQANLVCDYNSDLSEKKRALLEAIKAAQHPPPPAPPPPTDPSREKLSEMEREYESGRFDAATAAGRQVTDPSLQGRVSTISQKIASYNSAFTEGRQKESSNDLNGALQSYQTALSINSQVPNDLKVRIAAVEVRLHTTPAAADVSREKVAEAERAFEGGNLDIAGAAARQVTDKSLQDRANAVLQKISNYNKAMQEGRQKERSDHDGALRSYRIALAICARGPGEPAVHIRKLETTGSIDPVAEAARLNAEAKQAESRPGDALRLYQAILRSYPGNVDATAGLKRMQDVINSDPAAQAKVLADAIRAFYSYRYTEAEDDLTTYLSSPAAKYKGAAHFYLGASRLSRHTIQDSVKEAQGVATSDEVQRPFKDARTACYRPVARFLSPVVLSAWNISVGNAACSR